MWAGGYASHHHVDQPAGHHHHFLGAAPLAALAKASQAGAAASMVGFVGTSWHTHRAAQLAVDLQHQLDFVLHQGELVHLRKGASSRSPMAAA